MSYIFMTSIVGYTQHGNPIYFQLPPEAPQYREYTPEEFRCMALLLEELGYRETAAKHYYYLENLKQNEKPKEQQRSVFQTVQDLRRETKKVNKNVSQSS